MDAFRQVDEDSASRSRCRICIGSLPAKRDNTSIDSQYAREVVRQQQSGLLMTTRSSDQEQRRCVANRLWIWKLSALRTSAVPSWWMPTYAL